MKTRKKWGHESTNQVTALANCSPQHLTFSFINHPPLRMAICPGCSHQYTYSTLLNHLHTTSNAPCQAVLNEMHQYVPDDLDTDYQHSEDEEPDTNNTGLPGAIPGDFFGPYIDEEMPMDPTTRDNNIPEDGDEDEDNDEDNDDFAAGRAGGEHGTPPIASEEGLNNENLDDEGGEREASEPVEGATGQGLPTIANQSQTEQALRKETYFQTSYPSSLAGKPIRSTADANNKPSGNASYAQKIPESDTNIYAPFASQMDASLAQWAKLRGVSSTAFSEMLEIPGVSHRISTVTLL